MIHLSRHAPLQNRRFEHTLGRVAAPYVPSGENWSLSNTVMQSTSCSRSLIKNWQLEFHFGLRVSCIVLVMWHWEPIVTSQYGLLFPGKMETEKSNCGFRCVIFPLNILLLQQPMDRAKTVASLPLQWTGTQVCKALSTFHSSFQDFVVYDHLWYGLCGGN